MATHQVFSQARRSGVWRAGGAGRLRVHLAVLSNGDRHLAALCNIRRIVVDAGAVLFHRRGGDRNHRQRRLQALAQHQQARPFALGHLHVAYDRDRWSQAELAEFFVLSGLVALLARAWPGRGRAIVLCLFGVGAGLAIWLIESAIAGSSAGDTGHLFSQILLFFIKAGSFVFGSGLAIVPILYQGVVQQFGWLNEQQFLDAVAMAMITPGPVAITVAFIGFIVARPPGSILARIGMFLPVYIFTIIPAPWFKRHRDNKQLKAFVDGATAAATGAITGAVASSLYGL